MSAMMLSWIIRSRASRSSFSINTRLTPLEVERNHEFLQRWAILQVFRTAHSLFAKYETRRLAERALEKRLSDVNSLHYRARPTGTFEQFITRWERDVLTQHKRSTGSADRSRIRKHLLPYLGSKPMTDISTQVLQEMVKLGIERCGFHAFRHGNETVMDQENVPMAVRQGRLGHSDAETTMRYSHALSEDGRRFAARLGDPLAPKSAWMAAGNA